MRRVLASFTALAFILPATPGVAAQTETSTTAAAPEAPIDPARLAAAKITVDAVFPAGTYARMMNGTMNKMLDSMMDSVSRIPLRDLAGIGGLSEADLAKMNSTSLQQIMDIYDPAYRQRMQITTHTMMDDMVKLMTSFEPQLREGLAKAYARRFDTAQLAQLNAFFATPTGKAYAADSSLMMMSPDVMDTMTQITPALMKQLPEIIKKTQAATASLPKMRTYAELSDAEKARLATLLGVSRQDLDKTEKAKAEKPH